MTWRDLGWLLVDTLGAALFLAVAVGLPILVAAWLISLFPAP